jgi:hypothetical protein
MGRIRCRGFAAIALLMAGLGAAAMRLRRRKKA